MLKPTEKIARALMNLDSNLSWQEIIQWIKDSLYEQSIANNHTLGADTIKMQGRNLELEELLKHIENRYQYQSNLKGRK